MKKLFWVLACLAVMSGVAYAGAVQYNDEQGYQYNGPVTFSDTVTQTGTTNLTGATVTLHLTNTTIQGATNGQILIGNGSDLMPVTPSSAFTITNAGVATLGTNAVAIAAVLNSSVVSPAKLLNGLDAQIYISTPSQVLFRTMSGDATMANTGAISFAANSADAGTFYQNTVSLVIATGAALNTTGTLPTGFKLTGSPWISSQGETAWVNTVIKSATTVAVTINGNAGADVTVEIPILMP